MSSISSPGVTSVGLALPSIFTVSGSPVTTTGTLTGTLATQAANLIFAGPTSGGAVAPTFRSLVAADIPSLSGTYLPLAGGTMTGAILFSLDNTIDIGASGATRPRTVYAGTSIIAPSAGTSGVAQHAFPTGTGDLVSLDATQTLTNKTLTTPVIASMTSTSSMAFTANVADAGSNVAFNFNNTTALTGLTALAGFSNGGAPKAYVYNDGSYIGPKIGTSSSALHALPTGTGDLCSLDATQTLTSKTLTAPVIDGATSASGNFNLSGSGGTFLTTTGAVTIGPGAIAVSGDVTVATAKTVTAQYNGLGTATHLPTLILSNTTAAAAGAQQYSATLEFRGQGWKTDATAASQEVKTAWQARPVQGAASPTVQMVLWQGVNGASLSESLSFGLNTIGQNATQQHTVPAVASDTFALLAATQTLAGKTLTAPVINGATSSGSTSIDFSGNSGTMKTTTGAFTIGASSVVIGTDGVDVGDATHRVDLFALTLNSGASVMAHTSNVADSSTNNAFSFNNTTALTTTTSLATFGSNAVVKATIYNDGSYIGPKIGTSSSALHALPTGTGDLCSLDATQTLSAKTLTTPVINGATSSGSTAINLSGNSGTFSTPTGANTFGGSTNTFTNKITFTNWGGLFFSPAQVGLGRATAPTAGNVTTGRTYAFDDTVTILGARFYWGGGVGALTVKVQLWDPAGTSVKSVNVAVNAAGIYAATFAASYAVAGSDVGESFIFSAYETTATYYGASTGVSSVTDVTENGATVPIGYHTLSAKNGNVYLAGDAKPTTILSGGGTNYFPIEPVLQ